MKAAVALKYPKDQDAPVIAAKERGSLALRMESIAREYGIPVVHDEMLANVLSVQDIGACIPEETWQAVASIFAYIVKMEQRGLKNE